MRWDIRIANHYYGAAACLAVCLMAAPVAFHLEGLVASALFWLSLTGALVLTLAGFRASIKGEKATPLKGHIRRMIGLYGMVICGVGFIGFAAAYLWPGGSESSPNAAASQTSEEEKRVFHWPPPFRHIFDLDLSGSGGSIGFDIEGKRTDNGEEIVVPVRFIYDSDAQTKFLVVFVKREYTGRMIYDFVGANLNAIMQRSNVIHLTTTTPGDTASASSLNYIFTNVIFFYAEEDMSLADQAAVEGSFKKIGVKIQIRGHAYYTLHWNDAAFQETKSVTTSGH